LPLATVFGFGAQARFEPREELLRVVHAQDMLLVSKP
jgi:hypothetical protein